MTASVITVRIDDRIRLLSTLLALTTWPEQEQAFKPHGVHAQAKAIRTALAAAEEHPAVQIMQEVLESDHNLSTIFSYSACLSLPGFRARSADIPAWAPEDWPVQLRDFAHAYRVRDVWEKGKTAWKEAEEQARQALEGQDPLPLLAQFFGQQDLEVVFQPNLIYPTSEAIGFRWGEALICICPPHVAWGTNPPWPYDDDPAATYREAFSVYARILLREFLDQHPEEADLAMHTHLPVPNTFLARYPDWFDQFAVLVVSALTAIALKQAFDEQEAASFTVMAHKAHGFKMLPAVVDVLEHYLLERQAGKYSDFASYMPAFFKTLRVAAKLKNL